MKADSSGTMTEQCRARNGWVARGERPRQCQFCEFFATRSVVGRDGGCSVSLRCVHLSMPTDAGAATRATASCDRWERREQ